MPEIFANYNFNINNGTVKIIPLRSTRPHVAGNSVYKYTLYPGVIGGTSLPISSVTEKRRIYSQKELSDADNDGLRYFEEIMLWTDPDIISLKEKIFQVLRYVEYNEFTPCVNYNPLHE